MNGVLCMRFPNKFILDLLYLDREQKSVVVVYTSRFAYSLYRDVLIPRFDVIQRVSLSNLRDIQQIGLMRPEQYC